MRYIFLFIFVYFTSVTGYSHKLPLSKLFSTTGQINRTQIFNNGQELAFSLDSSIVFFSLADSVVSRTIRASHTISSFCISRNDSVILIGTEKGYLSIYRLDNYTKIFDKKVSDNSITGLAFNNRSSLFALGTSSGDLLLWDYKLKVLKYDLSGSHNYITALKFSLDDKFLLSAGQSKIIEIWEVTTGHKIKELRKHKSWVRNIAISPDGVNFASCGDDRKIYEWNIEDANRTEPEREIESYHRSWIMDIVYQDSADFLISVGHDNRICIHPLTPGVIKNFDRWKEQELRYKGKYFVNINQQYIQSVSISPGGFKLFIGTNNLGLFYTDYYQKFYEQTGSLLKAR